VALLAAVLDADHAPIMVENAVLGESPTHTTAAGRSEATLTHLTAGATLAGTSLGRCHATRIPWHLQPTLLVSAADSGSADTEIGHERANVLRWPRRHCRYGEDHSANT
jgi:hypothetical protein